ncbi:MAG: hypothetical protein J6C97_05050 [Clostridia bacterium]|nr:hypothetical protein [Clostridia bacterium]
MKIVKRVGVFETNSSSTHSFMIVDTTKQGKKDCAFELVSPLAKLVWFLGVVDNALTIDKYDQEEDIIENKEKMKKIIADGIDMYIIPKGMTKEEFIEMEADLWVGGVKKEVLEFKDLLIKEFCNIEQLTENEAQEEFIEEACRILPLENIDLNPKAIDQYIANRIYVDEDLKQALEKFKDKQQAFREYMRVRYQKEKQKFTTFKCDFYFENGCLNACFCGFQDFIEIKRSLNKIRKTLSWQEFAKWFLSSKCKVIGLEKYCGVYDIINNDQY